MGRLAKFASIGRGRWTQADLERQRCEADVAGPFDANDVQIYSRDALVAGNQGLSFLGATVAGAAIARVRITSGTDTIVSNGVRGNPNADLVPRTGGDW